MRPRTIVFAHRSYGFTLLELLVVIAIVVVVVALLIPAIRAVRERMDQTTCASNLHQIGLALLAYHNDYNAFPVGWMAGDVYSWNAALKGYLPTYNAGGNPDRVRIDMTCPRIPRQNVYHYNYMYNDNLSLKNIASLTKASLRPAVTDAEDIATSLTLTGKVKKVHRGGANYLYLDGHVEWSSQVNEEAWQGTGSQFQ